MESEFHVRKVSFPFHRRIFLWVPQNDRLTLDDEQIRFQLKALKVKTLLSQAPR